MNSDRDKVTRDWDRKEVRWGRGGEVGKAEDREEGNLLKCKYDNKAERKPSDKYYSCATSYVFTGKTKKKTIKRSRNRCQEN